VKCGSVVMQTAVDDAGIKGYNDSHLFLLIFGTVDPAMKVYSIMLAVTKHINTRDVY